jgi:hypothetical protein
MNGRKRYNFRWNLNGKQFKKKRSVIPRAFYILFNRTLQTMSDRPKSSRSGVTYLIQRAK